MPASISLLVAYPQELIRAGLRAMLSGSPVKIVGEASDAPTTLTLAKKHKPAVVLLDAVIPDGDAFELVTRLTKALPATKFILLSAFDNPTYMARARAVRAANFLLMGSASGNSSWPSRTPPQESRHRVHRRSPRLSPLWNRVTPGLLATLD